MKKVPNYSPSLSINDVHYKKICPGKNCPNLGTTPLRIVYIKKIGWFCDDCKKDLIDLKLVDEIENEERGDEDSNV